MNGYAYDESGRRRWWLIAGAVLAAVALLAVAFAIGRASAPGGGGAGGTRVVNEQSGPGPTRVVNGVPVGYAHTQAGAVAAATNYLMVVDGQLVSEPDKYRAAIDTLSAPEARQQQESDADHLITTMQNSAGLVTYAQQGHNVVFRATPLAFHVDRYAGDEAQVAIWAEGLIAVDGVLSLRETWTTSTVEVQWVSADWRLRGIAPASPSSFGPVPTVGQAPSLGVSLPPQLSNYRRYQVDVGT